MKPLLAGLAPALALATIAAMAGCSQSAATGNAAAPTGSQASASGSASFGAADNPCDGKLVTRDDVAAILGEPPTTAKPVAGVAQSCRFETASFSGMTVTVAPGAGQVRVTVAGSPHMPIPFTAVNGVGDAAEWQATTHSLVSQKSDLLCEIDADGPPGSLAGATADKLGALCNKIFAAS